MATNGWGGPRKNSGGRRPGAGRPKTKRGKMIDKIATTAQVSLSTARRMLDLSINDPEAFEKVGKK